MRELVIERLLGDYTDHAYSDRGFLDSLSDTELLELYIRFCKLR